MNVVYFVEFKRIYQKQLTCIQKREKLILGVKMTRSSYITLSECTFVTYIHTFVEFE